MMKKDCSNKKPSTPQKINIQELKSYEPSLKESEIPTPFNVKQCSINNFLTSLTEDISTKASKRNKGEFFSLGISENSKSFITKITNDIILPIHNEMKKRNKNSETLYKEIKSHQHNLTLANQELLITDKTNKYLYTLTKASTIKIQRMKIEKVSMEKEIVKIRKKNINMTISINDLNRETVISLYEYENLKNDVDTIKNDIKQLSLQNTLLINQKKIMKSALLLIQKKLREIKHQIYLRETKQDTNTVYLDNLFQFFK